MKIIWKSADQTEKQGIRLHVACILLVGVLGQNVTGQNVRDTMSWTKHYEDKMLLVKMLRHFVHDIFFDNIFSTAFCPMTFCQYNILSAIFCPVTFSPATLVGIQPSCSRPDKLGVRPISISEIQAMIACENCVCLDGLRSVGYRWIASGWIYSKPVEWLVGLFAGIGRLVGFMVGGWLAG